MPPSRSIPCPTDTCKGALSLPDSVQRLRCERCGKDFPVYYTVDGVMHDRRTGQPFILAGLVPNRHEGGSS